MKPCFLFSCINKQCTFVHSLCRFRRLSWPWATTWVLLAMPASEVPTCGTKCKNCRLKLHTLLLARQAVCLTCWTGGTYVSKKNANDFNLNVQACVRRLSGLSMTWCFIFRDWPAMERLYHFTDHTFPPTLLQSVGLLIELNWDFIFLPAAPKWIKMFVLDEADEMLSRGFKDQIYEIFQKLSTNIQVSQDPVVGPELTSPQKIVLKWQNPQCGTSTSPALQIKPGRTSFLNFNDLCFKVQRNN